MGGPSWLSDSVGSVLSRLWLLLIQDSVWFWVVYLYFSSRRGGVGFIYIMLKNVVLFGFSLGFFFLLIVPA